MENNSRTKKSIINISANMIYQILNVIANFVIRTVFIKMLSSEYLGINGLFTNILSVLSLAELGIGNAIIYSMYGPLRDNNESKLCGLISYYKKLYTRIGTFVLISGLLLVPFLKNILNLQVEIANINLYYILFLLNTVSSYFMIYKTSIVTADQKEFLLKKINIIFVIIKLVLQIIALVFKSYLGYLVIQIVLSILMNFIMSKKAEKMYPFMKKNTDITSQEKKSIWENIKSLFIYQFGGVMLNNTDNIIISIIVGTVAVGIYSNYSLLISTISSFTSLIFTSMISSIGNFNVKSDAKEKTFLFEVLNMIFYWVYGFSCTCFMVLTQDFIRIWIGEDYLLSNVTLIIIVFNFYLTGILYPILCFRNTTELFKKTKFIMIITSLINIVLSIGLGKIWGINGILIATAFSRLLTNIWYEPYVLYKDFFKQKVVHYYIKKIVEFVLLLIIIVITLGISNGIYIQNGLLSLLVKGLICMIIPNTIIYFMYRKTSEFAYVVQTVKSKISSKLGKGKISNS